MIYSTIIESLHEQLQWPEPPAIYEPQGPGPSVYARLARRKLAEPLHQRSDGKDATVGVLSADPNSDDSDAPVAIVCEFPRQITPATLREVHRLAWNFCRSPLLITIEPHLIRSWSCYETPSLETLLPPEPLEEFPFDDAKNLQRLADSLHWIELASGNFLAGQRDRFPSGQRADETLLENLGYVREKLTGELPEEITHDLLARLIFIQFLCHRKDSGGSPALNANVLANLHEKGVLSRPYSSLPEILRHKGDTYALFEWLNDRFNGDLFPDDWREERALVRKQHLRILGDFVSGDLEMHHGQRCLWPLYSFDAIPLEFVSSIYEEFVKKRDDSRGVGEHYTPPHIVDFVLDRVLPWGGTDYDVRLLDPACGSAAFLVKAFQRLVNRWRRANPEEEPPVAFLRGLLERNVFGVDIEPRAIRVASFSLYLAMCDEIDPRHYWTQVRFPRLRDVTLRTADFFREDIAGIRSKEDAGRFDLVVGNAPWGDASITDVARKWAVARDWPTADEQIGPLFLPKAAELAAEDGAVCMMQSASSLLFNRSTTACQARRALFTRYKVDEVVNFSALRFDFFPDAIGPTCLVTMRPTPPDGDPIAFWSPKQTYLVEDQYRVIVDAHDLNWLSPREAAGDPLVWSALMWGGRRDLELVRRLYESPATLNQVAIAGAWRSVRGFQRGTRLPTVPRELEAPQVWCNVTRRFRRERVKRILLDAMDAHSECSRVAVICHSIHRAVVDSLPADYSQRIATVALFDVPSCEEVPGTDLTCDLVVVLAPVREYADRMGMRILESQGVWNDCPVVTSPSAFPRNEDPLFERPRDLGSFRMPAILMKESWTVDHQRFRCIVVKPDRTSDLLLFSQSFYGIVGPSHNALAALAVAIRSSLAVHYFYLTSGRLASYRPTIRKADLDDLPLPVLQTVTMEQLPSLSEEEIDRKTFELYGLNDIEKILVEDFFSITLQDFKGDEQARGRQPLTATEQRTELAEYSKCLIDVLHAGFGNDKSITATVYVASNGARFPYCIVAIHLDSRRRNAVAFRALNSGALRQELQQLDDALKQEVGGQSPIFHRRVARVYVARPETVGAGDLKIPTVFIVKPNQRRYWSRSIALRDADEVTADILQSDVISTE